MNLALEQLKGVPARVSNILAAVNTLNISDCSSAGPAAAAAVIHEVPYFNPEGEGGTAVGETKSTGTLKQSWTKLFRD